METSERSNLMQIIESSYLMEISEMSIEWRLDEICPIEWRLK